jgi:hypothetical protein
MRHATFLARRLTGTAVLFRLSVNQIDRQSVNCQNRTDVKTARDQLLWIGRIPS